MPDNPTEPSKPFDVSAIHHLVRLMKRYDLTAIDLIEGPTRIRLRRRGAEFVSTAGANPGPAMHAAPASPAVAATQPPRAEATPPTGTAGTQVIESPMVGTYYASSAPDAPPFVSVGSVVRADSTVCVIEAMKVFTEIPAGVAGTIAEILVKNGQPVEFGQPMFRVHPA